DSPPVAALAQARELLAELEAIDVATGSVATAHGQAMGELAVHPRLAHMLIRAKELGAGELACDVAALLSERDVFRTQQGSVDSDLARRLDLMHGSRDASADVDRDALRRARLESDRLGARLSSVTVAGRPGVQQATHPATLGSLIALAYPDRVARRRSAQTGGTRA